MVVGGKPEVGVVGPGMVVVVVVTSSVVVVPKRVVSVVEVVDVGGCSGQKTIAAITNRMRTAAPTRM